MATDRSQSVQIEGLREFKNALRDLDRDLAKDLRQEFKDIAKTVADKARSSFAGGTGVASKVAPSVKPLAQADSAAVQLGGGAFPYAMGAEFGSVRFAQFPAWSGSGGDAGYHFYPALRAERDHVTETVGDLLDRVSRKAFPD